MARKHPHGRGEDTSRWPPLAYGTETPPRAWGRPFMPKILQCLKRNTPTGVGKTASRAYDGAAFLKHPHGRGEDQHEHGQDDVGVRNTPTGVGKTLWV